MPAHSLVLPTRERLPVAVAHRRSYPAKPNMPLTDDDYQRYARQMILPEIGRAGQEKLQRARVLVIGAGGLGAPALLYLAAAGVGHIDILDADAVDPSNLHRQVIHSTETVGTPKVESAARALARLNPAIDIHPVEGYITEENVEEYVGAADVVVDGCDNFPTRYLVNDACFFAKKPLCYAAVARFEGQASTFLPGQGDSPCYRCLFPEPPPPEMVRPCKEAGVLGVLPGMVGMIQATECLKLLLGIGKPLVGRLLLYDSLAMSHREITLRRAGDCALCGATPTITRLASYDWRACDTQGPGARRL